MWTSYKHVLRKNNLYVLYLFNLCMIKRIFTFVFRELQLLFSYPYMFGLRRFWCFFLNSILWIKKDLYYTYSKDIKIKFPNRVWVSYVLMETFVYKVFSMMHWLDLVLDIWGFIWESALYLSEYNKKVDCYELSKANFEYLKQNCKNNNNITYHNAWITVLHDEYIDYDESLGVDSTIRTKPATSKYMIPIKNINILTLLKNKYYDWLKLDIEWWEYEILQALLDNNLFYFKKWIIEFHDLFVPYKLSFLKKFIEYILEQWYTYSLLTNENKKLCMSDLDKIKYCNIYFELA